MPTASLIYDVVVVGAGISGLIATQLLDHAGLNIKCFEARSRVGGRALSVHQSGLFLDLGATWFWHNEPLVQQLVDNLGLGTFPQAIEGDALFETLVDAPSRLRGNPIDAASSRFQAGASSLALGLAAQLKPGVLELGDPVQSLSEKDGEIVVESSKQLVRAKHVIIAVPPALAAELISFTPDLPVDVRKAAEKTPVWMGEMVKAVAVYDSPFWRNQQLAGSAMSYKGPFREIHDHSGPTGESQTGALFGFAHSGTFVHHSEEQIAEEFRAQLIRLFGEEAAHPQHIAVMNWAKEKYTVPTRAASAGGFGHELFQQPLGHGKIHWASTEVATEFGGHLEGAVRAGIEAALQTGFNLKS